MERRKSERFDVQLDAEIILGDKSYPGTIENISEDGVEYLITSFVKISEGFSPDKRLVLKLTLPSGKAVTLNCEPKWYIGTAPGDRNITLGMKIINPPEEYKEFVRMAEDA